MIDDAHRMTDDLGDDHDAAALRQTLTGSGGCFDDSAAETLLALIDRRRSELQQQALRLGERFFADSPGHFAGLLKSYWKIWRAGATCQPN